MKGFHILESDRALAKRTSRQDAHAFDALMQRYFEQVKAHLRRLVRNDAAADDLAQEVFLRLWQRAGQWNETGSFRGWLMRMATNLALNHLRSVRRKREQPLVSPAYSDEEDDENIVPGWLIDTSSLGPAELVDLAEQHELARRLLNALPDGKRQVLEMVHEQEMDLMEVAQALGIPLGTVKSRLHYAFRQLGRQWRDLEDQQED